MAEERAALCRRNSWVVALAAGALVAVMLMAIPHYGFLKAFFIGALIFLALGYILVWAFCSSSVVASTEAEAVAPAPAKPDVVLRTGAASVAGLKSSAPITSTADVRAAETEAAKPSSSTPATSAATVAEPARDTAKAATKPSARLTSNTAFGLDAALAKSKDGAKPGEPEMLSAPRGGIADDLKFIKGIGPKLESLLNEVGVWHFDQIASWKAREIAFVDAKLVGFHGRITRDEWVKQARVLAAGGATEFSAKVKKGGVY